MNRAAALLLLGTSATLTGCAFLTGKPAPLVHRRYAAFGYLEKKDEPKEPEVRITVFAMPVPAAAPAALGITGLAGDAQAEMVRALERRTRDGGTAALVQAMALPLRPAGAVTTFRDLTRISRRLVFSVDHRAMNPADRVAEARIAVTPDSGVRFVSWNRMENEYQTVELGKLNLSQERSGTAELGLTLPVLSAAPSASATAAATLQEELMLRQRRTALTGTLRPEEAMLLQEGAPGIDLTGNVTADFELAVPSGGDETVFVPSLPSTCGRPSFDRVTLRYPKVGRRPEGGPDTVWLKVVMDYVVRHVRAGHETIMEGDDSVQMRRGSEAADRVVAVPTEALRVSVFQIQREKKPVMIRGATRSGTADDVAPLQFATFEEAAAMLAWMRRCGVRAVGHTLLVNERALGNGAAARMHVWRQPLNQRHPGDQPPLVN